MSTIKRGNVANFSLLEEVTDKDFLMYLIPNVREEITNHWELLSKSFDGYFVVGELETSEE